VALPRGLAVASETGPRDAQDGDEEQGGEDHIAADEQEGEDRRWPGWAAPDAPRPLTQTTGQWYAEVIGSGEVAPLYTAT